MVCFTKWWSFKNRCGFCVCGEERGRGRVLGKNGATRWRPTLLRALRPGGAGAGGALTAKSNDTHAHRAVGLRRAQSRAPGRAPPRLALLGLCSGQQRDGLLFVLLAAAAAPRRRHRQYVLARRPSVGGALQRVKEARFQQDSHQLWPC